MSWCCKQPSASCLRWLVHSERRAASRAAWTAGNNSATKIPMMAITTSNSTRVKPAWTTGWLCLLPVALVFRVIADILSSQCVWRINLY